MLSWGYHQEFCDGAEVDVLPKGSELVSQQLQGLLVGTNRQETREQSRRRLYLSLLDRLEIHILVSYRRKKPRLLCCGTVQPRLRSLQYRKRRYKMATPGSPGPRNHSQPSIARTQMDVQRPQQRCSRLLLLCSTRQAYAVLHGTPVRPGLQTGFGFGTLQRFRFS